MDGSGASRAYIEGNALATSGDRASAIACFRAALALDPLHVGALNNLGNLLRADGDVSAAIACYRRVLAIRPELSGTLNNLATALLQVHRPDEAADILGRAIALRADDAEAWNGLGGAHLALDRPDAALGHFRRALALDPALANARLGEAMALLTLGHLRDGFSAYESRWSDPGCLADEERYSQPAWVGEDIAGQTILIHAEQGLGDSIQFCRYVPMVAARGATVVLMAQPPLIRLFSGLVNQVIATGATPPKFDTHCPLLSLPHLFSTDLDTIPPSVAIAADPARVAAWSERLGARVRPRIGIAFSGSAAHPDDALRSIPAGDLVAALSDIVADVHVLQTDIRPTDAACLAAIPFVAVHAGALEDFAETAALIAHMDLVVSVDTSVAHLAATLGRPTWILVQRAADFRWLRERADSPWYPAARLFRQSDIREWNGTLARIAAELAAYPWGERD